MPLPHYSATATRFKREPIMNILKIGRQIKITDSAQSGKSKQASGFYRKWASFIGQDNYRLAGGVAISFILHIIFIGGYFGLADISKPETPPIQQINFVDLTEEPPAPPPQKRTKPKTPVHYVQPENVNASPEPGGQTVASRAASGSDRIFLDMPRKQVPISIDNSQAVAENVVNPNALIKISPAKGIQHDNSIARPSPIDLKADKKMLLASNGSPQQGISFASTNAPKIQLTGGSAKSPVSNEGIEIDNRPPKIDLNTGDIKQKKTETFITGPLASRDILKKIIPPFPAWAKKQGVGATIALRFTVMENGSIRENIIVERTSGSRDWDRMVIDALKNWQFAALNKNGVRLDQTGVITFQFVI